MEAGRDAARDARANEREARATAMSRSERDQIRPVANRHARQNHGAHEAIHKASAYGLSLRRAIVMDADAILSITLGNPRVLLVIQRGARANVTAFREMLCVPAAREEEARAILRSPSETQACDRADVPCA